MIAGIINLIGKIVMADKIFIDSNIWLYLFLKDEFNKHKTVENYMG